jgi:TolB-like protein
MKKQFCVHFMIIGFVISCASSPDMAPITGPYFDGDGGKNIRIAVLEPSGHDLSPNEEWLLTLVQGTLTNDLKKYSAMRVVDRQNLDKIIENQAKSASGDFSDENFISIGNLTNAQYILVGSIRKIPQNTFLVNLSISEASTGELKASYPPINCTFNELQGLSIIKNASEELLLQMGISLTDAGKRSLYRISETSISAETALSKGIHAQRNGTIGEALSYYYNAISFEPSLAEAKGRLSVISRDVSSGNIGESARNAIAYRNAWKDILT